MRRLVPALALILASLSGCARNGPEESVSSPPPACRTAGSIEEVAKHTATGLALGDPIRRLVDMSFTCEAVALKDEGRCDAAREWYKSAELSTESSACVENYLDLTFVAGVLRGEKLDHKLCARLMEGDKELVAETKADIVAICGLFAEPYRRRELGKTCKKLSAYLEPDEGKGKFLKGCRGYFRSLEGPAACSALKDPTSRDACIEIAAMVRALPSRDESKCGESRLCRAVISGKAGPCEGYRKKAASSYCVPGDLGS